MSLTAASMATRPGALMVPSTGLEPATASIMYGAAPVQAPVIPTTSVSNLYSTYGAAQSMQAPVFQSMPVGTMPIFTVPTTQPAATQTIAMQPTAMQTVAAPSMMYQPAMSLAAPPVVSQPMHVTESVPAPPAVTQVTYRAPQEEYYIPPSPPTISYGPMVPIPQPERPVVQEVQQQVEQPQMQFPMMNPDNIEVEYREHLNEIPRIHVEHVEKIVEIPQPQVVDRIVPIPQVQDIETEIPGDTVDVKLVTRQVPKIEVIQRERIVEVPEIEYQDRFVEVPEVHEIIRRVPRIEVREIPVERIIQVPKKVIQEIEQPVYRPVPHLVKQAVQRIVPIPNPKQMTQHETVTQFPVPVPGGQPPEPVPQQVGEEEYEVTGMYKLRYRNGQLVSAVNMGHGPQGPVDSGIPQNLNPSMPPGIQSMTQVLGPKGVSQPTFGGAVAPSAAQPSGCMTQPGGCMTPPTPPVQPSRVNPFGSTDTSQPYAYMPDSSQYMSATPAAQPSQVNPFGSTDASQLYASTPYSQPYASMPGSSAYASGANPFTSRN